jgi:hypothetical protein
LVLLTSSHDIIRPLTLLRYGLADMGAADRAQEEKRIAGIAHGDVTVSGKGEFEAIATPRKVIGAEK